MRVADDTAWHPGRFIAWDEEVKLYLFLAPVSLKVKAALLIVVDGTRRRAKCGRQIWGFDKARFSDKDLTENPLASP